MIGNLRDPFEEPSAPVHAPAPPSSAAIDPRAVAINWHVLGYSVLVAVLLVLLLAWLGERRRRPEPGPAPDPSPAIDVRFVPIGQAYRDALARVYAGAWNEGAARLDAGQPPEAALDAVAKAWDTGRVRLFENVVTPVLAQVVPEGKPAKDVTPEDRAKLAAAWRGFARGLGSKP